MEEPRQPRARRIFEKKGLPPEPDPLGYIGNKASDRVRLISSVQKPVEIIIYYDKHYIDRLNNGDENGRRDGIESSIIEDLVKRAFDHLLVYSSLVAGFCFSNHPGITGSPRIVIQEIKNGIMLNVVLSIHYEGISRYEITVKTAMCVDDFNISDGQYVIELYEGGSTLKKKIKNNIIEILTL
jgi:hypothetical protein